MGRIDKEQQPVFKQLSLSGFNKWSSTPLKTFNNYTIIMTSNRDKIRILWVWCFYLFFIFELIQQAALEHLDSWTTALMCIFSLILNCSYANQKNSIMNGWKFSPKGLLKAILCHQKSNKKAKKSSTTNVSVQRCLYKLFQNQRLHFLLSPLFERTSQSSAQDQQNGKQTYCQLSS